jgi:PHP family Zn ribbon phosphoesterase
MHRVEELADREEGARPPARVPYKNLIPLNEIIAQSVGKTPECQSVWDIYFRLVREFGDENKVLTEVSTADFARLQLERVGQGVARMRKGAVQIVPGHDGEFGRINLFESDLAEEKTSGQLPLF